MERCRLRNIHYYQQHNTHRSDVFLWIQDTLPHKNGTTGTRILVVGFVGLQIAKKTMSCITVETHKTLFYMIIAQTLTPFLLLYLPLAVVFSIPIFTEFEGFEKCCITLLGKILERQISP